MYIITIKQVPQPNAGLTNLRFGSSKTFENGIDGVGCNQFFASYIALGGDSIIWNVYANLVC